MLTEVIINEFASLLSVEDQTIWDVGDKINQYELGREDVVLLAEEVDRSATLLFARARLARMFPSDMWERSSHPIGVWEQLSRLEKPADRRRMLKKKKVWTANALRKEIDAMLEDHVPSLPMAKTVRVTRYTLDNGIHVAMKSVLTSEGVLSISLPAPIAAGSEIRTEVNEDGTLEVSIPLDVASLDDESNPPSHLKVVE